MGVGGDSGRREGGEGRVREGILVGVITFFSSPTKISYNFSPLLLSQKTVL